MSRLLYRVITCCRTYCAFCLHCDIIYIQYFVAIFFLFETLFMLAAQFADYRIHRFGLREMFHRLQANVHC